MKRPTLSLLLACSLTLTTPIEASNLYRRTPSRFVGLEKRQTVDDCGYGATCADACGAGWVSCGTGLYCYNPGAGDTCCWDDSYCPSGQYCAGSSDAYGTFCCPRNDTLQQCGVSMSVSSVYSTAPASSTSYGAVSSSSSSGAVATHVCGAAGAAGAAIAGMGVLLPIL